MPLEELPQGIAPGGGGSGRAVLLLRMLLDVLRGARSPAAREVIHLEDILERNSGILSS